MSARTRGLAFAVAAIALATVPAILALATAGKSELERLSSGYREGGVAMALGILSAVVALAGAGAAYAIASAARRDHQRLLSQAETADTGIDRAGAALVFADSARAAAAIDALVARAAGRRVERFLADEAEDELRRARVQFLVDMSHDLRSPLNSILGFSELLLRGMDGEVADDDRPPLVTIQRAGRGLLRLLNEILDTARCEAGKMSIDPEPVMPAEILRHAVEELRRGHPTPAEIEIATELQPGMASLLADPIRLPQALAHLLTHALASAPHGTPVKVRANDRVEAGARQIAIEVAHDGIAIGADWQAEAFAFHRLGPGDLGLAFPLARRLVELHGGSLTVEEREPARYLLVVPAVPPAALPGGNGRASQKGRLAAMRLTPIAVPRVAKATKPNQP